MHVCMSVWMYQINIWVTKAWRPSVFDGKWIFIRFINHTSFYLFILLITHRILHFIYMCRIKFTVLLFAFTSFVNKFKLVKKFCNTLENHTKIRKCYIWVKLFQQELGKLIIFDFLYFPNSQWELHFFDFYHSILFVHFTYFNEQ